MKDDSPFNFGSFGSGMPLPREVAKLQEIVSPWMEVCSLFVRSTDSIEQHMNQASRIYDIEDLVDVITRRYRDLALKGVEVSCQANTDVSSKRAIVQELDELAQTTVMWPRSWPKWFIKHYLRMSVVSVCNDIERLWGPTMQKLREFKMPSWMYTNIHEIVENPIPMLKDMLEQENTPDPTENPCYEECCRQWLNLVQEGMSESQAGAMAMRWFRDRKVGPFGGGSVEADIDALIGPIPPDMPMDGRP